MTDSLKSLYESAQNEPFAKTMGIECVEVGEGSARLRMKVTPEMANLFGFCHGGAIFSLMDDAFQLACNSRGVAAYALNLSITYIRGAKISEILTATANEITITGRTGTYSLETRGGDGSLVAVSQAVAYRKNTPPPFIKR